MKDQLFNLDMRDTFVSRDHLAESFPGFKVEFTGDDNGDCMKVCDLLPNSFQYSIVSSSDLTLLFFSSATYDMYIHSIFSHPPACHSPH